jgi:hypothetical protein
MWVVRYERCCLRVLLCFCVEFGIAAKGTGLIRNSGLERREEFGAGN